MSEREMIFQKNVVLIGLRGTGKSTCGRILAERLERAFLDTDEIVQDRAGKTIREIFEEGGEKLFRRIESEVVLEAADRKNAVIATGGGAILDPKNVRKLKQCGFVVHLSGSPEELWRRIDADKATAHQRPSLTRNRSLSGIQELEELLLKRSAAYSRAREVEVRVENRSPIQIVDAILLLMRARHLLPN